MSVLGTFFETNVKKPINTATTTTTKKMGKTFKILMCGKKATGKTTILEQLIYNNANISSNSVNSSGGGGGGGSTAQRPTSITSSLTSSTTTLTALGSSSNSPDKYFSTIEDIYVACWEKDKGVKEKLRFYDTHGMENSKDTDTINQMRHLFPLVDGCVLVFSSNDSDSMQCIEKLKFEIEKSKDKKEICHFGKPRRNKRDITKQRRKNENSHARVLPSWHTTVAAHS